MSATPTSNTRPAFVIWGRLILTALALLVQLGLLVVIVTFFSRQSPWLLAAQVGLSVIVLIAILGSDMPPEYKLAWAIPILLLPIFGGVFYLLHGTRMLGRRDRERLEEAWQQASIALGLSAAATPDAIGMPAIARRQADYLRSAGRFPPYRASAVRYFPLGELAFDQMLADLERAERYILCEYFIISAGVMWDRLFEVLARKASEGVSVRVLYDDLGSYFTLPARFHETLNAAGIMVQAVNPFGPRVRLRYNNRNHRKILVIDGHIAFTGGINIADEYINAVSRFGHWKDTVVRVEGPAAWSFAVMFLTVWDAITDPVDIEALRPAHDTSQPGELGWVQPFDDSPFDNITVGEEAYLAMIGRAQHTLDIFTPYLIVDAKMIGALNLAAHSGVRVRIVTPHIGDKWYVHEVTRSSYETLIEAGVHIFEYEPGYIHAKSIVADSEAAIIGTINFDYRSFYLHQECAMWMFRSPAIADMVADVEETIARSIPVTLEQCRAVPWYRRTVRTVLRTFAPMM